MGAVRDNGLGQLNVPPRDRNFDSYVLFPITARFWIGLGRHLNRKRVAKRREYSTLSWPQHRRLCEGCATPYLRNQPRRVAGWLVADYLRPTGSQICSVR